MHILAEHGKSLINSPQGWQFTPEQINYAWPQMEPLIQETLQYARGECEAVDIYRMLTVGQMQAFAVALEDSIKLLVITEFVQYPRYKTVRIVLLAGEELNTVKDFIPAFENWALMNGAVEIEAWMRPGMLRLTKQQRLGYEQAYIGVRKDLRRSLQ